MSRASIAPPSTTGSPDWCKGTSSLPEKTKETWKTFRQNKKDYGATNVRERVMQRQYECLEGSAIQNAHHFSSFLCKIILGGGDFFLYLHYFISSILYFFFFLRFPHFFFLSLLSSSFLFFFHFIHFLYIFKEFIGFSNYHSLKIRPSLKQFPNLNCKVLENKGMNSRPEFHQLTLVSKAMIGR